VLPPLWSADGVDVRCALRDANGEEGWDRTIRVWLQAGLEIGPCCPEVVSAVPAVK
jgi:hypothetical protein